MAMNITMEEILKYCDDVVEERKDQPLPLVVKRDLDDYLVCYMKSGREVIRIYHYEEDHDTIAIYARLLGLNTPPAKHAVKDENGLLPCAHCGGEAVWAHSNRMTVRVACKQCTSQVSQKRTTRVTFEFLKDAVFSMWNRRVQPPADPKWERLKAEIVSRNEAEVEAIKSLPPIGLPQSVRDAAYATGHVLGWIQGTMTRIEQEESK